MYDFRQRKVIVPFRGAAHGGAYQLFENVCSPREHDTDKIQDAFTKNFPDFTLEHICAKTTKVTDRTFPINRCISDIDHDNGFVYTTGWRKSDDSELIYPTSPDGRILWNHAGIFYGRLWGMTEANFVRANRKICLRDSMDYIAKNIDSWLNEVSANSM
jgi:hypothetical protein